MQAKNPAGLSAETAAKIEREVLRREDEIRAAKGGSDPQAARDRHEELFAGDLIDIHASGWLYTRAQSIELEQNLAATPRTLKVVRSTTGERHIRILAENVVAVTSLAETYFEAPNPMQQALDAGTFTMAPGAKEKAAAAPPFLGPGEGHAPNPYRSRITRIWVKEGETWKLALSQATRLGKRLRLGY